MLNAPGLVLDISLGGDQGPYVMLAIKLCSAMCKEVSSLMLY